jgi:hypothetical protein
MPDNLPPNRRESTPLSLERFAPPTGSDYVKYDADAETISLCDVARILRRYAWVVVLCTLLSGVAAFLLVLSEEQCYSAKAVV